MKRAICAAALMLMGLVGCSSNKSAGVPVNSSVADVPLAAPATPAYTPAAQPVVYDTAMASPSGATPAIGGATGSIGAGNYVVKHGDTLYGIARQRYGDGKQWSRIASANPGLRPETLKVGQSIVIP